LRIAGVCAYAPLSMMIFLRLSSKLTLLHISEAETGYFLSSFVNILLKGAAFYAAAGLAVVRCAVTGLGARGQCEARALRARP